MEIFYYVMGVAAVLLGPVITFFNVFVLYCTCAHKLWQKELRFVFVFNICMADSVLGLLICLMNVLDLWIIDAGYSSITFCAFDVIITEVILSVTLMTLLAMVTEYYVKIVYPLRYWSIVTVKRIGIGLACIWATSILHGLLPLVGINWEVVEDTSCSFLHMASKPFLLYAFVVHFLAPTISGMACIVRILSVAHAHRRQIGAAELGSQQLGGLQRAPMQRKGAVSLVVTTLAIILTWVPYNVMAMIKVIDADVMRLTWTLYMAEVSYLLHYLPSLIYPISRVVRVPEISADFKRLFRCRTDT